MSSIYNNTVTFDPTGTIQPLTNIKKTIELGTPAISVSTKNFGLMLTFQIPSKYKMRKIFKIETGKSILISFAGTNNDSLRIFDSLQENLIKNEDKKIFNIFGKTSKEIAIRTITGSRLNGNISISNYYCDKIKSFVTEEMSNVGNIKFKKATAIGFRMNSILTILEKNFKKDWEFEEIMEVAEKIRKTVFEDEEREIFGYLIDKEGKITELNK